MNWLDKLKVLYKDGITLNGRNLGVVDASFGSLTNALDNPTEKQYSSIKNFEKAIINIMNASENIEVESVETKNGSAIIPEGTLCHSCPLDLTSLESISKGGLLCTEWFGVLESENEGRFCAFLSEAQHDIASSPDNTGVVLYFDKNHPIMKMLLKNDYFDYIKRKKDIRRNMFDLLSEEEKNEFYEKAEAALVASNKLFAQKTPDELKKYRSKLIDKFPQLLSEKFKKVLRNKLKEKYNYDDIILDLYDDVVEPMSYGSISYRDNPESYRYHWKAIPGGVPSKLITAVRIPLKEGEKIDHEMVKKIQKMFPQAIIIDNNNRVLTEQRKKSVNH